jgi:hypothetical protein
MVTYDGPPRPTDLVGHGTDHHHLADEPANPDRFGMTG